MIHLTQRASVPQVTPAPPSYVGRPALRDDGVRGAQAVEEATRADLLRRVGALESAAQSYTRALALVTNDSERRFLERRRREVQPS